jgi:hypothetical protein
MPQRCGITFLTDATIDEIQKVFSLIEYANKTVGEYFGIITSFDILICRGSWEMEVQVISRKQSKFSATYDDTKSIGITDYRLEEIVIRYDIAKFGHYLHELIHGIISKSHPHQLREGLAWYFTLKLTEEYRYVRPPYPSWVNELYIYPTKRLAEIVGDDFLKDLAIGEALVQHELLPKGIQDLFLPEEVFYSKMTFYHGDGGGS